MAEIYSLMLINLKNAGIGILIFLLAYMANISFSLYYNIKVLGQNFNREQMWNSFLRIITFAIGISCLVIVITALPLFANYMGLPLPDEFVNNLTMVAIIGFPLYLATKYAMMAFEKMKKILESGTITLSEFEEEAIESASVEEVKNNKNIYDKIINSLKEVIEEDSNRKKLIEMENLSEELLEENKEEDKEETEEDISKEIILDTQPTYNSDGKLVVNPSVWTSIFEPLEEEQIYTSQDVPDEVNVEEMEKEQLEG